jgi:RNA polymerase sigma-70 factor (sigma-E family)
VLAEPDGFAAFVAARYAALVRTAFLFVGDRGHAEDLVQSALSRTYSHWARIRSRSAAEAYTRTTMARLAGRWSHRRWVGELASGVSPEESDGLDPLAGRAQALDLYAALGRLPWPQRAVLVLRYFEDLSEAETAAVLRCSPGTVKSRASRALAALRLEFPGLGGDTTMSEEATARE